MPIKQVNCAKENFMEYVYACLHTHSGDVETSALKSVDIFSALLVFLDAEGKKCGLVEGLFGRRTSETCTDCSRPLVL